MAVFVTMALSDSAALFDLDSCQYRKNVESNTMMLIMTDPVRSSVRNATTAKRLSNTLKGLR